MPGFLGTYGLCINNNNLDNCPPNYINKKKCLEKIYIESRSINKFLNDKIFNENKDFFILVEGVVFNKKELITKYKGKSFIDTIIFMYKKFGDNFFNEFRGSFSGLLYDKLENKVIIYTDHIGDKQIFYSNVGSSIFFGSEINYIVELFNINNIKYTFNRDAAYYLITYGFMLEDNTLFCEINKLIAGKYIIIKNGKLEIVQYHKFNNTPYYGDKENEIVQNIDTLFRQAIKREFEKDIEYGYKHLVSLSGGLDSRMTTWVANDMGYGSNIVNYTFSQTNYLDETISKEIASYLKHEWIFKSLDNGLFLTKLDEITKISSGCALYYGLAHGKSLMDLLDHDNIGVIHTGQLGDVILGTFFGAPTYNKQFNVSDGAYSNTLLNKNKIKLKGIYENEEIFKFYTRGFLGANQGLLVEQEFTETFSPFYDLDFFEYCLRIPVEYRYNHKIYFKWINEKYPEAAKYKWEKINARINDKQCNILGRQIVLKNLPSKSFNYFMRKLRLVNPNINTKKHMNPLDYWYRTNKDLKDFMDSYYVQNIDRLDFDYEIKNDCINLYNNGNCVEKNQVLSLLSFLKLYF